MPRCMPWRQPFAVPSRRERNLPTAVAWRLIGDRVAAEMLRLPESPVKTPSSAAQFFIAKERAGEVSQDQLGR